MDRIVERVRIADGVMEIRRLRDFDKEVELQSASETEAPSSSSTKRSRPRPFAGRVTYEGGLPKPGRRGKASSPTSSTTCLSPSLLDPGLTQNGRNSDGSEGRLPCRKLETEA